MKIRYTFESKRTGIRTFLFPSIEEIEEGRYIRWFRDSTKRLVYRDFEGRDHTGKKMFCRDNRKKEIMSAFVEPHSLTLKDIETQNNRVWHFDDIEEIIAELQMEGKIIAAEKNVYRKV